MPLQRQGTLLYKTGLINHAYIRSLQEKFLQILLDDRLIRVIHDCKGNHIGSELHMKCSNFRNISSIQNVLPVVDKSTKIFYANRFCAECSNIQHFVALPYDFLCSNELLGDCELLSLPPTQENQMFLLRSGLCNYFFKRPDPYRAAEHRCLVARYNNCEQAEDAVVHVSWNNWRDCISTRPWQDHALCAYCAGQSDNHTSTNEKQLDV